MISLFQSSKTIVSFRKIFLRFINWKIYYEAPQFGKLIQDIMQIDSEDNVVKWFIKYF